MDEKLTAMEQRLLAAIQSSQQQVLRKSKGEASFKCGNGHSSSPDGLGPIGEDGAAEDETSTQRSRRLAAQAAERKHQSELKHREKFMAKFNSKEIFGEKSERMTSSGQQRQETVGYLERCRKRGIVIDPNGPFRQTWDMVSVLLIAWIAIFLPFRLAFEGVDGLGFNLIDLLIDLFFMGDVALNLCTAYYDDGHLILGHKQIFVHYMRTWMAFDVLSSFPFDWLLVFPPPLIPEDASAADPTSDVADVGQLIRIVRVVKLLRLLRVARLFRYLNRFEDLGLLGSFSGNLVRLFKLTIFMFLFCHWNGCIQFLIASLEQPPRDANLTVHGWAQGFPHGFHEESWVVRLEVADADPITQWEWAFFTAIAQMLAIAIGVVEPQRSVELWGYMISILFGAVLYAIFVAVLTAVVADMDTSARSYRSRLDMMNQYMQHSELPRETRLKLRTFFHLCYPSKRLFDEDEILTSISRPLRQEVCLHKCRSVLAALQLLDNKDSEHGHGDEGLPGAISQELQRVVFVAGDYIIREGEETEGLFFVSQGVVELFKNASGEQVLTTLGAGALFGEMALLSQSGRAVASVRVKTFCEGYHLSKLSFNKVTHIYPTFREYLESVARLRLQKQTKQRGGTTDLQTMLANAEHAEEESSFRVGAATTFRVGRRASGIGRHKNKAADARVTKLVKQLDLAPSLGSTYAQDRRSMGYAGPDSFLPKRAPTQGQTLWANVRSSVSDNGGPGKSTLFGGGGGARASRARGAAGGPSAPRPPLNLGGAGPRRDSEDGPESTDRLHGLRSRPHGQCEA